MDGAAGGVTREVPPPRGPLRRGWRRLCRWRQAVAARPSAVVVVWVLTRALIAAAGLEHLPYPRNDVLYNDVEIYVGWSQRLADGDYPAEDPMWQYPPLAGLVFALPRLTPVGAYVGFVWLALLADLGILVVLLVDARRRRRLSGAWLWAFTGLVVGPIMLGRFDVFPTLLAVAAVAAAASPVRSGVWAGLGALLKVWPALTLLALPRRRLPAALAGFAVTGLVAMVAFRAWGRGSLSFLTNQAERGLQVESVGALPYLVANWMGGFVSRHYQYGSMEITNPGAKNVATGVMLVGVVLLLSLAVLRLAGRLEPVAAADVAYTAVLVSVATSRVFSPQYSVWLLGLGALCLADGRSRLRPAVWLVVAAAVPTQLLYPQWYGDLLEGKWFAVAVQALRVVLVVLAAGLAMYRVAVRPGRYPPVPAEPGPGPDQPASEPASVSV